MANAASHFRHRHLSLEELQGKQLWLIRVPENVLAIMCPLTSQFDAKKLSEAKVHLDGRCDVEVPLPCSCSRAQVGSDTLSCIPSTKSNDASFFSMLVQSSSGHGCAVGS